MSMNGDPTTPSSPRPAPMIGKIGPYTVFVTPPPTPKPTTTSSTHQHSPLSSSSDKSSQTPIPPMKKFDSPAVHSSSHPPVLPPPVHYNPKSDSSSFAFFWNALAKVQHAHSSLDEHVAHWFGLNQSKYQWALDDYYESKGVVDQVDAKVKDISRKTESV